MQRNPPLSSILLLAFAVGIFSCNNAEKPVEKDIAVTPEELSQKIISNIKEELSFAADNSGNIGDSVILYNQSLVKDLYSRQEYQPMWSAKSAWNKTADSLASFIAGSRLFGLFPEDYHASVIAAICDRFTKDTAGKTDSRDAALWSRMDIALTDAFIHLVHDVKLGRLPNDSVSLRKDSTISNEMFEARVNEFRQNSNISQLMSSLEPKHEGYRNIKASLAEFLQHASGKDFTKVPSLKENPTGFRTALQKRLFEGGYLPTDTIPADSTQLSEAVKKFQQELGIAVDGQAEQGTLRMLNQSDHDRFVSVAITMDRYKLLPETMPERYIWVNLPGYYMQLRQGDSVALYSKVVCGKPLTRTPLLTSAISDIVTYPQWTIPTSIIAKEILPGIKKNPDYLAKKGFSLVDGNGDEVDPHGVDWSKYTKGIPYKVVQGSGDDNALGVLKFNFPNKYAVYLHDTNQRYLFGQAVRSLSHGCVRVQQWKELAHQLIRFDNSDPQDEELDQPKLSAVEDSMNTWLVRKEKHRIAVHKKVPVFIRYFTCEAKNGKLVFYDDIYGEDRFLQSRYFARK